MAGKKNTVHKVIVSVYMDKELRDLLRQKAGDDGRAVSRVIERMLWETVNRKGSDF